MAATKMIDYRKLNDELTALLDDLQSSDVDIDNAISKYERGMTIVKELQNYLKVAENKIEKVKASF